MTNIRRLGDLEISQDLNYQERIWTIERIGWGVISLGILAGLKRMEQIKYAVLERNGKISIIPK